jgi:hypothetical protein
MAPRTTALVALSHAPSRTVDAAEDSPWMPLHELDDVHPGSDTHHVFRAEPGHEVADPGATMAELELEH